MNAINKCTTGRLPSYIIFVLKEDLISHLDYANEGSAMLMGNWIQWLVKEISAAIAAKKKQLPLKALIENEPSVYWLVAPTHINFQKEKNHTRITFNNVLQSVIRKQPAMRVMKLKDPWTFDNTLLVNSINGRITTEGLHKYWQAIDSAFEFNHAKRLEYLAKGKMPKPVVQSSSGPQEDEVQKFFKRHRSSSLLKKPFHKDRVHWH